MADADVIVVGAGLAGLVAAAEIADGGRRVIVVEQEPEQSLGGQAFWSLGGLFLVNSPEQRRLGIRDSYDRALQDWMGSAGFDRDEDLWPRRKRTSRGRPARSAPGSVRRAFESSQSSAGPSEGRTRYPAFTSCGGRDPVYSSRSYAASDRRKRAAWSGSAFAIA